MSRITATWNAKNKWNKSEFWFFLKAIPPQLPRSRMRMDTNLIDSQSFHNLIKSLRICPLPDPHPVSILFYNHTFANISDHSSAVTKSATIVSAAPQDAMKQQQQRQIRPSHESEARKVMQVGGGLSGDPNDNRARLPHQSQQPQQSSDSRQAADGAAFVRNAVIHNSGPKGILYAACLRKRITKIPF